MQSFKKLSWEDTAREMAATAEDWCIWDSTANDGLNEVRWESALSHRLASPKPTKKHWRQRPSM